MAENIRQCVIETASVELDNGCGDGAYDLLDVSGSPDDIGKAIAESLKDTDLMSGSRTGFASNLDNGQELYLTVRIKFWKPSAREDSCEPTATVDQPVRHPSGCSCGSPECPEWQAAQSI